MFIIWGRSRVETKLGYVADFCPICRTLRPFQVSRIGSASHVYFLKLGKGELIELHKKCQVCQITLLADVDPYSRYYKKNDFDLEQLISVTFPDIHTVYQERLDLENRIRRSEPLSSSERNMMLFEPYVILNRKVEMRYSNNEEFNIEDAVGCLATILISFALLIGSAFIFRGGPMQGYATSVCIIIFCIGSLLSLLHIKWVRKKYVENKITPQLARTLIPLKPTQQELDMCMMNCSKHGFIIEEKINWDNLHKMVLYPEIYLQDQKE